MAATVARLDQAFRVNGYASEESGHDMMLSDEMTPERIVKADGHTPKRRGPKPDSKPALTRRQELNRQAQRTHRERKETYIKALEAEVLRLKDTYASVCHERDASASEVRRLREALAANGIVLSPELSRSGSATQSSADESFSGSYAPPSTSAGRSPPPATPYGQYNSSLSPPPSVRENTAPRTFRAQEP